MAARGEQTARRPRAALWWRLVSFLSLLFGAAPLQAQTAFFYGTPIPVAALSRYQRVVVEADHLASPQVLQAAGAVVFAYVSVGEAEGWRASTSALPAALFRGEKREWGSRIADLAHPQWREFLLEQRMAALWDAGYRGFFLDTLDSYRRGTADPAELALQTEALATLIRDMHRRFPGVRLLLNRGFDVLPAVAPLVDGVVAESLFERWNQVTQSYAQVPAEDREWLLGQLNIVRQRYALPVTVIDYVSPQQTVLAQQTAARIRALGFQAWVANPGLDTLPSSIGSN